MRFTYRHIEFGWTATLLARFTGWCDVKNIEVVKLRCGAQDLIMTVKAFEKNWVLE